MKCYYCGAALDHTGYCPECDADVRVWKKVSGISNRLYNEGLEKAQVRDLSGAVEYLKMSLRYNKMNMNARNLLGLVYFEMGETVNAVSEWVISKGLIAEDNPAAGYLAQIQKSSARLENLNQTIKKFNQALVYCKQGSYDLALIQLKKVLALNPKMVKGHQLIALLYMREERYDLAKRALRHAAEIDKNNTNTMRYLKECSQHLQANGKVKPTKEDTVSYQSGNDIIIRPAKFTDNTAVLTVVNLLIGAAIGIAVVCFLIIPGVRQNANNGAKTQLVRANETISTREQTIKSLEEEIAGLNTQLEDAKSETNSADEKTSSYEALLDAYVSFSNEKFTDAGKSLANVKKKLLSDDAKEIYDTMMEDVRKVMLENAMNEAMVLYGRKDYTGAIEKFKEIVKEEETYDNCNAAYYMAYAYMFEKDYENAIQWFQVVVDNTSSGTMRRRAQGSIDEMEALMQSENDTADDMPEDDTTEE